MSTFSKTIVIGFLGDDPKSTTFDNGNTICNLSVATSEKWKDKNTGEDKSSTEWHRVVLRNKLGELAEKYLKKGSKVLIEGKMKTRSWEKDGVKHYVTELIANNMTFMGTAPASQDSSEPKEVDKSEKFVTESKDDDLPF